MPYIEVTKTYPIAEDGIHTKLFSKGWKGNVSEAAANILFSLDAAIEIDPESGKSLVPVSRRQLTPSVNDDPKSEETKTTEDNSDNDSKTEERVVVKRVHELADELGTSSAKIIDAVKELDISATAAMSGLSQSEIDEIVDHLKG